MSKKYDLIVFIGRFQPVHIGHIEVIKNALKLGTEVLILIGSANQPRTSKNPWTYKERVFMITDSLSDAENAHVAMRPLRDQSYNDQMWVAEVQRLVGEYATSELPSNPKIGLIGHEKDDSSYYLRMFPQWDLIEHNLNEQVSATDLRELLFEGKSTQFLRGVVPAGAFDRIEAFKDTKEFSLLAREYEMIKAYKKAWERAPYPPTFVTTDAVVIQSGHILMIERDAAPGEGLLAMPGGFLNQNEWIIDGMIRELREETRLKVPAPVLKGSIKHQGVYDRPDRSLRGRTITHAFLIELPAGPLPPVKGGDDARKAFWIPINDIREEQCFEDHYHIIQDLLGKL